MKAQENKSAWPAVCDDRGRLFSEGMKKKRSRRRQADVNPVRLFLISAVLGTRVAFHSSSHLFIH
ncbi:hypothetical protein [Paenibacillus apii]|uniref:hypothetical protein n=1 Tax=Paenibacillus apii TaxID=1850370 RepID=UPI00143C39BC|nr:hypothetical protein [Paenibacillus apii]NJJ40123.1 hypothetical protein [Paenibacillus apii]